MEESDETTFLVLEFVDGRALSEILRAGGMPWREAIPYARQIADALGAAHERGIIHRDLKPENVMVTPDGQLKVLDFGIGKALEGEGSSTTGSDGTPANSPTITTAPTRAGIVLGTAGYMSPEQAKGRPTDRRSDVWAFGCVLYEMLTGRRAFEGEDITETVAAIVRDEPDWTRLPADLPPNVRVLLERCLVKDRAGRLADMSVVRFLLSDSGTFVSSGSAAARPDPPAATRHRWAPVVLATAVVAAALTYGATRWLLPREAPTVERVAHVSMALPAGVELGSTQLLPVAISRDGTRVAFVGRRDGKNQIYVRALEEREPEALEGGEGGDGPFLSPDGRWIAFFSGSKLRKTAVGGTALQTLADAPGHRGGNWGDDGYIYFAPTNMSGIWRVPEGGGAAEEVTSVNAAAGEISHRWPHRIPGTDTLLFSVWTGPGDDEHHVATQSIGSREHHLLVHGGDAPQYAAKPGLLLYAHSGELLTVPWQPSQQDLGKAVPVASGEHPNDSIGNEGCGNFAVSDDGTLAYLIGGQSRNAMRLVWIDRAGTLVPLPLSARAFENVAISPDGTRAVVQIREGITRLWIYDFGRGTITPLSTGSGSSQAPLWTADGTRVIFRGTRGGTRNLYWIAVDGSGDEERLASKPKVIQTPTSVSADGRWLLFDETGPDEPGGVGIWVMRLDGDRSSRRLFPATASGRDGQLSPDSKWVAYQSDVSSRQEIFVAPFPGPGERRLLSTDGGTEPLWSRDGRDLYFQSGTRLMGVSVAPGASFSASSPRVVHEGRFFATINGNTSFNTAKDGARFLRIQPVDPQQAITRIELVLNWFSALNRRVSGRAD